MRLDQALGFRPEPLSPAPGARPPPGVRLTLPEPIGLQADVLAALDRLLARLCATLAAAHLGARRLRLELRRVDHGTAQVEIGLARPGRDPARIAALFARGMEKIDAGFGIDALRLSAPATEPLAPEQVESAGTGTRPGGTGRAGAGPGRTGAGGTGPAGAADASGALADLLSSIGNRIGFERVQRLLPAESLIPERSFLLAPAAWTMPAPAPARSGPARPCIIFPPEPVTGTGGHPPARFRWRRMVLTTLRATGPERIAPEWWFDDPAWRPGLRDYWQVETNEGPRLWLFHTPQQAGHWAVQGEFA